MNTTSVILFHDVGFSYGEEPVLSHCNFEVLAGSHVALKGASGSGKSTILKLVLGFFRPQQGEILYRGRTLDVQGTKKLRSQTAWLPAEIDLGEGTVRDVIHRPFEFAANRSGKPEERQVLDLFEKLDLERGLYVKPFRDLSTGQRQRVGLALCLLLDKPLLLLDEPTSALNADAKRRVADLVLGGDGRTVISASHDAEWLAHADQIYEL